MFESTWLEVLKQFLHDTVATVMKYEIPAEIIINADQDPIKICFDRMYDYG